MAAHLHQGPGVQGFRRRYQTVGEEVCPLRLGNRPWDADGHARQISRQSEGLFDTRMHATEELQLSVQRPFLILIVMAPFELTVFVHSNLLDVFVSSSLSALL